MIKVTNYNYGYSDFFNCSIHGQITISEKDFNAFIKKHKNDLFSLDDICRRVELKNGAGYIVDIRVTATRKLAEMFGFSLKNANYRIKVITK